MKALCNHFSHKVQSTYSDDYGIVHFGFADCEMQVINGALVINVQAETEEGFQRVQHVIDAHLERFGSQENLQITWQ
ncbi:MAG: DUF2218 domain-containing protein [Phototrophicales bacterium]|nr:MAG: DUF2218 domain-containing protein [Phototrophicales bacterium]